MRREFGHEGVQNPEIDGIAYPLNGQIDTPQAGIAGLFDLNARAAADADDAVFPSRVTIHPIFGWS
ncbi:hypothetical protein [Bosea vaviloviae]|uniref:Uncharacterized protein n=1 Tax=Bosea vaviloviae TaxID=1526658 RepID=A0A1D7TZ48_9HYPH|nr:hypothetical protein [Bosea vaviloviae]AOO80397.1 hypothetical protein BHK69_07900 [Bosea vaviloviae]